MAEPAAMALVVCPLCGAASGPAAHEAHLLDAHGMHSYRGVLWGREEAEEAIRLDLFSGAHGEEAWSALARMARAASGRPAVWLAGWLARELARIPPDGQEEAARSLAAWASRDPEVITALTASAAPGARALALECLAARPAPADPALVALLRPLMYDRGLPASAQDRITAAHLASSEGEALGRRMLRWVTARLERGEALRRLHRIRGLCGGHAIIDQAEEKWLRGMRLSCPRCGKEAKKSDMEAHLWSEHRLLLEGMRAVSPWEVIERWAREYRETGDEELLARCRAAAVRADPAGGEAALKRLLLALGCARPADRAEAFARARSLHVSLCPLCYADVPVPEEAEPLDVRLTPGRLWGEGYRVEVFENGLFTRLVIATPSGVVYDGQEPGQPLTPMGAATAFGGPVAALALVLTVTWPIGWLGRPLPMTIFFLLLSVLVALFAWLFSRFEQPASARLLSYAWEMLAPRLNARAIEREDCAFLAGLARLTSRLERWGLPGKDLDVQADRIYQAGMPPELLAPLARLRAEVAASQGIDPVRVTEEWVARCFEGKLPLTFAQKMLEDWATTWWTAGQVARLRARLCDRAFEDGFEVQSLLDAGNTAPALGSVLGVEKPRGLAALRLLWSLRASRPWSRLGEARTAFEMSESPSWLSVFESRPDVLLWSEEEKVPLTEETSGKEARPAEVVLTPLGVWVQGELFTMAPLVFELRARPSGSELMLDGRVFRSPVNLEPFSRLLERWFRFAFYELLPAVDGARHWATPDRGALLRAWGAVACPGCGKHLLPRAGATGTALEDRLL